MVSVAFPGRPFNLRDNVLWQQTDVANNRSLVSWELWIDKTGTSPTYSGGKAYRWMKLDGQFVHEYYGNGFDFRNGTNFLLASGQAWINHTADGTKNLLIEASADFDTLGATSLSVTVGLPSIPRASQPSLPNGNWVNAGSNLVINTNRASSSFTHELQIFFGNYGATVATGIGDSYTYTPPLSLLQQIPNSATGTGTVRLLTFSGGNYLGFKDVIFGIAAGSEIVPVPGTASVAESSETAYVSSVVGSGVYVQNLSRLTGTLSGSAGVYGSTITGRAMSVGSQVTTLTGTPGVGTQSQPITVAGSSVPITFTAADSRSRSANTYVNINVLQYSRPLINAVSVSRSNSSGVADLNGTYIRVTLNSNVSSLINSTQRNRHTIRAYTRLRGTTSWGSPKAVPLNASTNLSYNSTFFFNGPFDVASAYDVRIEVSDQFMTTAYETTVSVAKVLMHLNTVNGEPALAVGKYHENGTLDVGGRVFATDDYYVGVSLQERTTYVGTGTSGTARWVRLASVDGVSASQGASVTLTVQGGDNFGQSNRHRAEITMTQRGADVLDARLSSYGFFLDYRIKKINSYAYELWIPLDNFSSPMFVTNRGIWGGPNTYVGAGADTTTEPSSDVAWTQRLFEGKVIPRSGSNWSVDPKTGILLLAAGTQSWSFDYAFPGDARKYRIDYAYYTGDENGAYLRLRRGGTDITSSIYAYQGTYYTPTGVASSGATGVNQFGFPFTSAQGHHGYLELSDVTETQGATSLKKIQWQDQTHTNNGGTIGGGYLAGEQTAFHDGFTLALSATSGKNGIGATSRSWVAITPLA